jgi:succinate dehydrogenase / fumarate reductase, cytochrome b subunit
MPASPAKTARPLSPHLQVYKPQLTSGMSIFHRFTGIGLAVGLPVLVIWLVAIAQGSNSYNEFMGYARTCIGQICLFGWTWAFFYHFCNGIRHLIWDTGRMLTIEKVYLSGYIALGVSALGTVLVWLSIYGVL